MTVRRSRWTRLLLAVAALALTLTGCGRHTTVVHHHVTVHHVVVHHVVVHHCYRTVTGRRACT